MMITFSYLISYMIGVVIFYYICYLLLSYIYICKQELIILYHYYLLITLIYNETYHVNKGVIASICNISSIILALTKSDNNNNI